VPAPAALRVLVVDDNRDAAASLADLLRYQGHQVTTAFDGPEALQAARDQRPAVVLLDLGMPGMSGHEVARHLRDLPEGRAATLIAVTGWGQDEDRRRSREAGFDHHLVKPVEPEALARLLGGAAVAPARG
jgi:CheY-like chemotaxis protein